MVLVQVPAPGQGGLQVNPSGKQASSPAQAKAEVQLITVPAIIKQDAFELSSLISDLSGVPSMFPKAAKVYEPEFVVISIRFKSTPLKPPVVFKNSSQSDNKALESAKNEITPRLIVAIKIPVSDEHKLASRLILELNSNPFCKNVPALV